MTSTSKQDVFLGFFHYYHICQTLGDFCTIMDYSCLIHVLLLTVVYICLFGFLQWCLYIFVWQFSVMYIHVCFGVDHPDFKVWDTSKSTRIPPPAPIIPTLTNLPFLLMLASTPGCGDNGFCFFGELASHQPAQFLGSRAILLKCN